MVHFFTPGEANRKLQEVQKLVADIVDIKKKLDSGLITTERENRAALDRFSIIASKLTELGIELKDADMGLVDFPSMRFNEPVYLCWKLGESEVLYWHGTHEGYRGRKLLRPQANA